MLKRMPVMGFVLLSWMMAPLARAEEPASGTSLKAMAAPVKTAPAATATPAGTTAAPAGTAAAPGVPPTAAASTAATATPAKDMKPMGTVVELKTSEGNIKLELADKEAPVSVKNFLSYVNDKFYDGVVFHRVIDQFMVQGGGYTVDGDKLTEKPTKPSIANEGKNGLKNDKGTVAMARTASPDSATAQFFINLVNNDRLNYPNPDGHGYAVFGKVIEGMDVIEKIGKAKTGMRFGMQDVPQSDIKILAATVLKPTSH